VAALLARTEPDAMGNEPFVALKQGGENGEGIVEPRETPSPPRDLSRATTKPQLGRADEGDAMTKGADS
jgi:hypothetical protein